MDTVQVIVLVVVVLIVLALLGLLLSRRRKQKHVQLAEEHRTGAREELRDLQHQRVEADAAEARAAAARAEAERAEVHAREAREAEQVQHARAEDKIREADRLDPRVDHKSEDYDPRYDQVVPQSEGGHEGTGTTGTTETGTNGTTGTGRPVDGGEHRA